MSERNENEPFVPKREGREASIAAEGNRVHLSLPSDVDASTVADFVKANAELLETVAEEMGAPGLKVKIGALRVICDGCGQERPVEHDDWTQTETGHDYCPNCSPQQTTKSPDTGEGG